MAVEIRIPAVGESISEGRLVRWLKKNGDHVQMDEPILELETEKASTEIPALAAGVLTITIPEGRTVAIGSVVGRIEEQAAPSAKSPPATPAQTPAPQHVEASATAAKVDGNQQTPSDVRQAAASQSPALSPAARRLAEEKNVDVRKLTTSKRAGLVTKEDVLAYLEGQPSQTQESVTGTPQASPAPLATAVARPSPTAKADQLPSAPPTSRETRQQMSPIRKRIADRLVASQQSTASLTTFNEADLAAVQALRSQYKEGFREKYGVSLGFMSFFVKACVEALQAYPAVNARIDGDDIVYHHYYHVGVAVSTERGLMVPVIRDADRLSFAQIEKQLAQLSSKARDGKITVADLQGGTFTITNGGVFGSLLSTPIINPPQSAILGMHAIQQRPVAIHNEVMIRPMMYLALSYDHRLIDGREAVLFLVRVKECIENPERLLLEV
jgi:2-oxoglutarate dehydrogenase E2 component (dihydrolipoamide succinyltransferase)